MRSIFRTMSFAVLVASNGVGCGSRQTSDAPSNEGGVSSSGGDTSSGGGTSAGGSNAANSAGGLNAANSTGGLNAANSTGGSMPAGAGGKSTQPDPGSPDAGGTPPGWTLLWSDEFDGRESSGANPAHWLTDETGNVQNGELEYYSKRPDNVALDGKGALVITARAESYMGRKYTSGRLRSQGLFDHAYGRFEARIQIPSGQGLWPAFWLLGNNIDSAGWPTCGEIDIMENIGKEPATVHATIHGPGYSGGNGLGAPFSLPNNTPFSAAYHVFATEWETNVVRSYVDGQLYETRTPADTPNGARWVYDHPFFITLNVAVGGQWPGNPDGTTVFPQRMSVDYVRVYARSP